MGNSHEKWEVLEMDKDQEIEALRETIYRLRTEIEVLRQWGNKDCTAMADEELERRYTDISAGEKCDAKIKIATDVLNKLISSLNPYAPSGDVNPHVSWVLEALEKITDSTAVIEKK